MSTKTQELLQQSVNEIKRLRYENSLMQARLTMFDNMMLLFKTKVEYQGQGMSPDIVLEIERHLLKEE